MVDDEDDDAAIDADKIIKTVNNIHPVAPCDDGGVCGLGTGGNTRTTLNRNEVSMPLWSGKLDERQIAMLIVFASDGTVYGSSANWALDPANLECNSDIDVHIYGVRQEGETA